jgi:hypothetical protein
VSASLSGRLPKGEANGLGPIGRQLLEEPDQVQVAVVLLDCSKITEEVDTGDRVPTIRIRRIEAIVDRDDREHVRRFLLREYERRTGKTVLPFELERDLTEAFGPADSTSDGSDK